MAQPYVFISYSRNDRDFVEQLVGELRNSTIRTWTDLENIAPGQNWAREIEKGLLEADALIYVSSRSSVRSAWMNAELDAFLHKAKRVIPLVIDDEGADNLPAPLRTFQWVDFRGPFQPALQSLLKGIQSFRSLSPVARQESRSKGYVFISYADEDADFVADLKIFLKKQGYAYWDFRESERNYQADYTLELENVIKNAAGTLSVVSPEWKLSPTALQELHFSREVKTPVFLLKVRDPGPTLAIAGMTYIDFLAQRKDGFVKLDSEMRRKGL